MSNSNNDSHCSNEMNRRMFVGSTIKSAVAIPFLQGAFALTTQKNWTVEQIMNLVLKEGNLTRLQNTVDTLKSGSPTQTVTGILTTMFATIDVIHAAVNQKANFIIAHEPTFYNHTDNPEWVKDNVVTKQKQALLAKHGIAVWRFHDYCHALKPDAVSYGVVKKAGWQPYFKPGEAILKIPTCTMTQLVAHLKKTLKISHVRVVGTPTQHCERIALLPGAWGGQRQVTVAENEKPDVLIVGEAPEWETIEYIRDARSFGRAISLIVLGHAVSEEPGMEWFAEWLRPKVPGLSVSHLASGDPFSWM